MVIHLYAVANEWFYLLIIAILEALAVYTWQFRKMPGAKMIVLAQICKMIWLLSLVLASISAELTDKMFWVSIQMVTAVWLVNIWLIFILQLSRQKNSIPPKLKYGLGVILCGLSWLLLSNWHGVILQKAWLEGKTVFLVFGPGQLVVTVYAYLLGIISMILAVRWVVNSVGLRRRQALWYCAGVLVSWVCHGMWRVSGGSLEVMPWGFLINGAIVTWIYYRWQLYNILPLAQAIASRHVIEGMIIIDEEDYVVDINPAAERMFEGLPMALGNKFQAVRAAWPALGEAAAKYEIVEAVREHPIKGVCYYQLRRIPLQTSFYQSTGRVILLYDITEQKRNQAQMIEQQKSVAAMEERANLARELHDNLCQTLGYINVQSQAAMKFASKGQMAATVSGLSRLTGVAQRAYDDVREYIHGVQTIKMGEKGLAEALREYVGWIRQEYDLGIELDIPEYLDLQKLNASAAMQLLRIAQEALTNSIKHAKASRILLELKVDAAVVRVIITDNGKGFNIQDCFGGMGYGLITMRERAETIGGALEITSASGQGTKVVVEAPLIEE